VGAREGSVSIGREILRGAQDDMEGTVDDLEGMVDDMTGFGRESFSSRRYGVFR